MPPVIQLALRAAGLSRVLSVSEADGCWASLSGRSAPVAGTGPAGLPISTHLRCSECGVVA